MSISVTGFDHFQGEVNMKNITRTGLTLLLCAVSLAAQKFVRAEIKGAATILKAAGVEPR